MDLSKFEKQKEKGESLPERLTNNRDIVEGNIIYCLWKNPELYAEYPLNDDDFLTYDGSMLYSLGKAMVEDKIVVFDQVAVETFLNQYPALADEINNVGGVKQILREVSVIDVANVEKYYDEINKWNTMISMHLNGFDILRRLETLKEASAEEIYDLYDYLLNDSVKERNVNSMKVSDLFISDDFFEKMINGEIIESIFFGSKAPFLNNILNGVVLGKVHLVSGHSGTGKSTFVLYNHIIPSLINGEKCCIITNELTKEEYVIMIMTALLVDKFNTFDITRKAIQNGRITQEGIVAMKEVKDYINENLAHNLKFVDMDDYDSRSVIKVIRKFSKVGYRLFLYDTMKADDSADAKAWAKIIEASKVFQTCAKRNNVAIILTYQIASHSFDRRWLNRSMLSQGKQIIEVVHSHIMLREIKPDEYNGEKADIKPYTKKRDENGKFTQENEFLQLNRDKKYVLVFVDKNRSGGTGDVLLYEFKGHVAKFREIGFCSPRVDG